jgi:hypothetical protein
MTASPAALRGPSLGLRWRWLLRPLAWSAVAAILVTTQALPQLRPQAGTAVFAAWAGPWSGDGTLTAADGSRSHIRCLVAYAVQNGGYAVGLDLRCASDAYRFEIASNMVQSGQSLSGDWFESTRRVGGRITGRATGNQLDIRAEGDTFTALVTVTTENNRQTFLLESPGSQLSEVSITLSRGSR